ncbi:hypothetical protein [Clostridium felsineum]|uniref:hypothetical protein n=1 Tax=Clostridium felsineum TaxID=36839 RepID=UPI00098C4ACD|nr:hypothetical protein [Clostridium felsineum]URZ18542.1 hypothetical protein CLFE_046300 [Clostridium felsineum DSM 794]
MNKIKLSIKTSKDKKLKYYVYRSIKKEDVYSGLEGLQEIEPVIVVDESLAEISNVRVEDTLILDTSCSAENNMIRYLLKHTAVKDEKSALPTTISINFNNPEEFTNYEKITIDLSFDSSGAIKQAIVTNKDKTSTTYSTPADIENIITMEDESIYITNKLASDYYNVTCDYYIEVIEVEDYTSKDTLPGIVYLGPNAHGLNAPKFTITKDFYTDETSLKVPYLKLQIDDDFSGLFYYYTVIAIDHDLNVSNPSEVIIESLNQAASDINYTLRLSTDYSFKDLKGNWTDMLTGLGNASLIELGKPGTDNFKNFGAIVSDDIPIFKAGDIIVNSNYVNSDNVLVIKFPNVWYEHIYDSRKCKAYELMTVMNKDVSEESPAIYESEYEIIPIEKLIVIKRTATKDNAPTVPSKIGDVGSEIIKTYLRKNGLYYVENQHGGCPYNVVSSDASTIVMSDFCDFSTMEIDNINCNSNEKYNYTFYLFDSYGRQSNPISVLVSL